MNRGKKNAPPYHVGFFVFGLQRSGTNYVQTLMHENFTEGKTRAAWKHRLDVWEEEHLDKKITKRINIVIHKHPLSWIESITKRGGADYIKTQVKYPAKVFDTQEQEDNAIKGFNLVNLAKTWQEHYDNWVTNVPNYIKKDMIHVWYEDLLIEDKRHKFLETIRDKFRFTPKHNEWFNPSKVGMSSEFNEQKRQYYINYDHDLTDSQRCLICDNLTFLDCNEYK